MLVPDCRTDETYNEDFLNEKDREFIRGYDYAIRMALDNGFNNLDDLIEDNYVLRRMNEQLPEADRITYEEPYGDEGETRETVTHADLIRYKLLQWAEDERDNLITAIIDEMDDEEYEKLRAAALARNERSEHPKEYKNTRALFGDRRANGVIEDDDLFSKE